MISDDGLRDAKTGYDMVKEKLSNNDTVIIICGHHLDPFSKIVNNNDDIAMPPRRVRVTCHETYAPFSKLPTVTTGGKGTGKAHCLQL